MSRKEPATLQLASNAELINELFSRTTFAGWLVFVPGTFRDSDQLEHTLVCRSPIIQDHSGNDNLAAYMLSNAAHALYH